MPPIYSKEWNRITIQVRGDHRQGRTSPCEHACPLGNGIQQMHTLIAAGETDKALARLHARNPFPGITGRVCPHPCETKCNRAEYDEPVAIHALERFAADTGHETRFIPLPASGKRIAVVGPLADDAQNQLGDWAGSSGQVGWMPDGHPRGMITTVLDGFRALAGDGCEVTYARGANVIDLVPDPEGEFYPDGQPRPKIGVSAPVDRALLDEAVAAAREADLIVAGVGDVVQLVGETCSTATLELLGGQNALLDALADVSRETGKPMVTVLVSSKPQVLPRSIVGDSGVLAGRCNDPKSGAGSILWAPVSVQ